MKNLDPKRREELHEENHRRPDTSMVVMTKADLMPLLAASELLDDALAENRAWANGDLWRSVVNGKIVVCWNDAGYRAIETSRLLAARLGWEQEGR